MIITKIESMFKLHDWECNQIREGYILTENLGSELDSATIVLPSIEEISIENYDVVKLTTDNSTKYYCVADYTKLFVTYEKPYKYDYTITLMSLTKILETIQLPSMSVTNIGQNRSISYYVDKVRTYFKFDGQILLNDIPSKYRNIVCPELTLTNPTLREYLDYLFSTQNEIARVVYEDNDFKLKTMSLNAYSGDMPKDKINTLENGAKAESYVTNLVTNYDAAIGQEEITDYVQYRSNDYSFTTDNAQLNLSKNIYDLKKVIVNLDVVLHNVTEIGTEFENTVTITRKFPIDITKYVVEKSVYDALHLYTPQEIDEKRDKLINYHHLPIELCKNNAMYYEEGKNAIENTVKYESYKKIIFTEQTKKPLELAVENELNSNRQYYLDILPDLLDDPNERYELEPTTRYEVDINSINVLSDVIFEFTYQPYINSKLEIEQVTPHEHYVYANNNQSDSKVNIETFSKQSLDNVNQLGNEQVGFTATIFDETEDTFKLGMRLDDYVLIKIEKTIHGNMTNYKGILSKYFANKNIYTTIDRTKRYTALQQNDLITRHDIGKNYVYLKCGNAAISNLKVDNLIHNKGVVAKVVLPNLSYLSIPNYLRTGNSITYTVEMPSNIYYGIAKGQRDGKYQLMQYLNYVDENGECENPTLKIYAKNRIDNLKNTSRTYINDFPRVTTNTDPSESDLMAEYLFTNYLKDNREVMNLSLESIFVSGNEKVIVGEAITDLFATSEPDLYYVAFDKLITHGNYYYNGNHQPYAATIEVERNELHLLDVPSGNIAIINAKGELVFAINNYDHSNDKLWFSL